MYDVCIIGAGIVGCAIARRLSSYDVDVCVLEAQADVACGSTKANSAIVHGGYAEAHSKLKGRLCYQGRTQFAQLDSELHFGFDPIGSLVLAYHAADKSKLLDLLHNGQANGLTDIEIITGDTVREIEPNIAPGVEFALWCEGAGVCSPYEMAIALMENAIHNGVELKLSSPVSGISKTDDGFRVEYSLPNTSRPQALDTKLIINCAGVNSAHVASLVGADDFSIHPRTGEYLLFARGTGAAIKHVLFQLPTKMGKGILVTPTYHGNLLVGPDAIDEDSADVSTSVERLSRIFEQALTTTHAIQPQQFIRSFAGARAVSSTDDFIIGPSAVPGFIQCAGIQSPGLTSSPAIADMVADLIGATYLELRPKERFDPNRRAIISRHDLMPAAEAAPLVALDPPNPERLVCRCEQVSERTITDALTREIPVTTIDGVKRRTRAGMGYCQGSFCRARVAELMGRTLGIPIDPAFDVEHSGINRVQKPDIVDALFAIKNRIDS